MAAINGKLFRIQIGNGASPEVFADIAGAKTDSLTINNNLVDIATKDDDNWTRYLEGAGMRSISLTVSGVFNDASTQELLEAASIDRSVNNYKIVKGNGDYFMGAFIVTNYGLNGQNENGLEFSATLNSSGEITRTTA